MQEIAKLDQNWMIILQGQHYGKVVANSRILSKELKPRIPSSFLPSAVAKLYFTVPESEISEELVNLIECTIVRFLGQE